MSFTISRGCIKNLCDKTNIKAIRNTCIQLRYELLFLIIIVLWIASLIRLSPTTNFKIKIDSSLMHL